MRRVHVMLSILLLAACVRGSDVTHGAHERLGPGQWTVDGIELGEPRTRIEARLGPGEQVGFLPEAPVIGYGSRRTAVTFDREGRATGVSGRALLRDGEPVLEAGQDVASVIAALGEGYIVERFTPTTSGIFTTGSVPGGAEHYYHDGSTRFQVFVNSDAVIGGIHCAPMDAFPLPVR